MFRSQARDEWRLTYLKVKKGRSEDSISFDSFEKGRRISPVEEIDLTKVSSLEGEDVNTGNNSSFTEKGSEVTSGLN